MTTATACYKYFDFINMPVKHKISQYHFAKHKQNCKTTPKCFLGFGSHMCILLFSFVAPLMSWKCGKWGYEQSPLCTLCSERKSLASRNLKSHKCLQKWSEQYLPLLQSWNVQGIPFHTQQYSPTDLYFTSLGLGKYAFHSYIICFRTTWKSHIYCLDAMVVSFQRGTKQWHSGSNLHVYMNASLAVPASFCFNTSLIRGQIWTECNPGSIGRDIQKVLLLLFNWHLISAPWRPISNCKQKRSATEYSA